MKPKKLKKKKTQTLQQIIKGSPDSLDKASYYQVAAMLFDLSSHVNCSRTKCKKNNPVLRLKLISELTMRDRAFLEPKIPARTTVLNTGADVNNEESQDIEGDRDEREELKDS